MVARKVVMPGSMPGATVSDLHLEAASDTEDNVQSKRYKRCSITSPALRAPALLLLLLSAEISGRSSHLHHLW